MINRITGQETIGQIVTDYHAASNVFKEFRIDFCCGGNRKLSDALRERHIEEAPFLKRLNMAVAASASGEKDGPDPRRMPLSELIATIVHRHHAYLREELPVLSEFTNKIMRVHGQSHPELKDVATAFAGMKRELDEHLAAEEERIFPLVERYERTGDEEALREAVRSIEELEADHERVGDALKLIRAVTRNFALPPEACRTYTLTFRKLENLESDLFEHVHLENNILFPRLQAI